MFLGERFSGRLPLIVTLGLLLITISSCGFHLRGTEKSGESRIESLYLYSPDTFGALTHGLRERFEQNGTRLTETEEKADLVLRLSSERRSRRPVTTTSEISVAEYEIRLEVDLAFSLSDEDNTLPQATLYAQRVYSFNEGSLVGNSEEERLLVEEMRQELIDQIVRQSYASLTQLTRQRNRTQKESGTNKNDPSGKDQKETKSPNPPSGT